MMKDEIHTPKYKREDVKGNFHSICPTAELMLAEICEEGDNHYGEWNWTNLGKTPLQKFKRETMKHLMRHLNLYRSGDRSEDHLGKVMWGCMALIHYDKKCKHEKGLK